LSGRLVVLNTIKSSSVLLRFLQQCLLWECYAAVLSPGDYRLIVPWKRFCRQIPIY